ncbi:uncharacterized protein LOC133883229 [Phragmites australis]|uniref:uncharacterized protein LOC133883229 n=1 Tax=Phragmites australis TaxID=29695 RepID=UPI002D7861D3|nr:uncharacterized protein LOC133883229 [Phragmites australis]
MDCQSTTQLGSVGSSGAAMQEYHYAGGGQPQQAVDDAFLMELLEDAPAADQPPEDADRLSHVIRSLEAEIGGGSPAAPAPVRDGCESTTEHWTSDVDVGLEDMLSGLDSLIGPCAAEGAPFEYWTEVPPAVGHDMGGWYADGDGIMVGYEFREQCYYTYGESPAVEQVYSPLWE